MSENTSANKAARGRPPSSKPNPVDVHLGKRIRQRRLMLGLSQEEVGEAVGLTFQQIQKYEYGTNRISALRLLSIGRALNCGAAYFYENMADETAALSPRHVNAATPDPQPAPQDSSGRESLTLMRSFRLIRSGQLRQTVIGLAHSLARDAAPAE